MEGYFTTNWSCDLGKSTMPLAITSGYCDPHIYGQKVSNYYCRLRSGILFCIFHFCGEFSCLEAPFHTTRRDMPIQQELKLDDHIAGMSSVVSFQNPIYHSSPYPSPHNPFLLQLSWTWNSNSLSLFHILIHSITAPQPPLLIRARVTIIRWLIVLLAS